MKDLYSIDSIYRTVIHNMVTQAERLRNSRNLFTRLRRLNKKWVMVNYSLYHKDGIITVEERELIQKFAHNSYFDWNLAKVYGQNCLVVKEDRKNV
jgi:hypothetical protein